MNNDPKLYSDAGRKVKISLFFGTCAYSGLLPLAPGTWGSILAAVLIYLFIPNTDYFFVVMLLALFALGIKAADVIEDHEGVKDSSKINIDEALGMALAVAFLPKKLPIFLVALIAFRLFDILKPPPIKKIDKKVKGGLGVMLDDIVAGVFANILTRFISVLFL